MQKTAADPIRRLSYGKEGCLRPRPTSCLLYTSAVTAYAGGGEEWDGLAPVEPLPAETVDPGEGFTEDGNLVTRDLLYDKATNKQFITVQTLSLIHI